MKFVIHVCRCSSGVKILATSRLGVEGISFILQTTPRELFRAERLQIVRLLDELENEVHERASGRNENQLRMTTNCC